MVDRPPAATPSWDFEAVSIALEESAVGKAMRHDCLILVLLFWPGSLAAGGVDLTQDFLEAARQGKSDVLQALLAKGANPNIRDTEGRTPLYLAAAAGHDSLVELLLNNAAQPDLADRYPSFFSFFFYDYSSPWLYLIQFAFTDE